MHLYRAIAFVIVGASLVVSCGEGRPRPAATTPTAAVTESVASPAPEPSSTPVPKLRTGIPAVDDVIDLQETGGRAALVSKLGFTQMACSWQSELGYPPPCKEGEAEGQMVDVFSTAQCEGMLERPAATSARYLKDDAPALFYAVIVGPGLVPDVDDDYIILFTYPAPEFPGGFAYALRDGKIVADFSGCGGIGSLSISERASLVPLLGGSPGAPATNIAALDRITGMVMTGDSTGLSGLLHYREHTCSTRNFPSDPLYCRSGEPDDEPIDVVPAGGCAGQLVRPDEAARILSLAVPGTGAPLRLLAIGLPPQFDESGRGDFRMFFSRGNAADALGFELDVLDGQIIRYAALCRPVAEAAATVEEFLLQPTGSLPAPSTPIAPDAPSTGISELDEIVAALLSGDRSQVTAKMVFTLVPCDSIGPPAGPECAETEAPATLVEAFMIGISCYPYYDRRASAIGRVPLPEGMTLYAAHRGVGPVDRPDVANGYRLVFAPPDPSGWPLLYEVRDGGIVGASDGMSSCGHATDYARGGQVLLVPPPELR